MKPITFILISLAVMKPSQPLLAPISVLSIDIRYDGKSIGGFRPDVTRRIQGSLILSGTNNSGFSLIDKAGCFDAGNWISGGNIFSSVAGSGLMVYQGIYFNSGPGDETAPASISAYVCIKY
jgi:hypothetical protein